MPSPLAARFLARLALAWFALYLGAAVAAPLVAPGVYAVICSADGAARLVHVDDADLPGDTQRATLHCPLCVPAGAPPKPCGNVAAEPLQPSASAWPRATTARPSAATAAPPPARGPPAAI